METTAHHPHEHELDPVVEYSSSKLAMWLFLGTEILLFGGLFAAYSIFRAKFPEIYLESHKLLDLKLGTINTLVLIFSSFTMALGVSSAQKGENKKLQILLAITIICGLIFGINKYFEYSHKFHDGIFPSTNIFFGVYFLMTGLHMLHVLVGLCILGTILVLAHKGKFTKEYNTPVEVSGLYWHLVDLIWIYLFPLLYLIG